MIKRIRVVRPSDRLDRSGVAMIEMALVLPVFLMLILGIIEVGQALSAKQLITNAAREGARVSVFEGSTNDKVTTTAKSFLSKALNIPAELITVQISISDSPDYATTFSDLANAGRRDQVSVAVSVDFDDISYIAPTYLVNSKLESVCTMRHE